MLAGLFALTSAAQADESCTFGQSMRVHIGAQTFNASIAASENDRERGLSGRTSLAAESGMFFALPTVDWHGFWMQGMNFPIDLIWISPERRVLGAITLPPCTSRPCPIHLPPSPVAYVLEINAGEFAGKTGDTVTWRCTP
jgi:uncharacterized protein